MTKKSFTAVVAALLLLLCVSAYGNDSSSDLLKNHRCGTPNYYPETVELSHKGLKRALSNDELIQKGYANPDGTANVKAVGDVETFWVVDNNMWAEISATLVKINEFSYVYVQLEDAAENKVYYDPITGEGYITQGDVNSIAREFYKTSSTENIYDRTRDAFGVEPPTGINGDPRVTILLLDIDSDYASYTETGNLSWWDNGYIAGYFYSVDTFTEGEVAPTYHSNERKIIYIDTYPGIEHGYIDETGNIHPDPTTDHADDVGATVPLEGATVAYPTLAHEFQHMINYYHDNDEDIWVNEGGSGLSEYLNGYGHPFSIEYFVANSSDSLVTWDGQLADYGNTYLFVLYLYEHFNGTPAIQNLLNEPENGAAGVEKMTQSMGMPITFKDLLINWLVANYFDSDSLEFKYRYDLINIGDYGTGDTRDGINSIPGSSFGFGFVDSMAAEYVEINYDNLKYLTLTGTSFSPAIAKISANGDVIGIEKDMAIGEAILLSDFGTAYSKMLLIAANTSSTNNGSYSYSLSSGEDTDDKVDSKNRTFLCFIASASYLGESKVSFLDKVLGALKGYMLP